MKIRFLAVIALCAIASVAFAKPGASQLATLTMSAPNYSSADTVSFTLTNVSNQTLVLPGSAPWQILYKGQVVPMPGGGTGELIYLSPGTSQTWLVPANWLGTPPRTGKYNVVVSFYDAAFNRYAVSASFALTGK